MMLDSSFALANYSVWISWLNFLIVITNYISNEFFLWVSKSNLKFSNHMKRWDAVYINIKTQNKIMYKFPNKQSSYNFSYTQFN